MVELMDKGRLIRDPAGPGAWNMAVDQVLLETANQTGLATLRFYRWSRPTLSLGYFQQHAERRQHPPSLDCELVRRTSGGGAIIHDHEITYSLCIPSSNRWSTRNIELYDIVHFAIIDQLSELQIGAELYGQWRAENQSFDNHPNEFLCFHRRTDYDIVIGPHKICGSAQRRLKNSVSQHGSLLLSKSVCAPELTGIENLTENALDQTQFCQRLTARISQKLSIELAAGQLSKTESESAAFLKKNRFENESWTNRR